MKTQFRYFSAMLLLFIAAGIFTFSSCRKKSEQPVLPPQASFQMDFNQFPDTGSGKTGADTTYTNWTHSVITVVVWKIVEAVVMAVPVAAYAEALKQTPKWDKKEKKWKWEFSVNVGTSSYTCKLYGVSDETNLTWQMYISQSGVFENFLWYEGVTAKDQSQAQWTLYKNPASPAKAIDILYHKNSDGTSDIKYTNVESGAAGNGGYIQYGLTNDTKFNAFFDVYVIEQSHQTEIKWHLTNKGGQVKDSQKFGDGNWHCWDTLMKDAVCL